jgi:hypothetical protein
LTNARHLAVSHLSTSPTAMGLNDPVSFLFAANKLALHSRGARSWGSLPPASRLTTFVRAVRVLAPWAGDEHWTAALMKEVLNEDGPGAELSGKDFRASRTWSSEMTVVAGVGSSGIVGAAASGCSYCKPSATIGEGSARPREAIVLAALPKRPSCV